VLFGASMQKQRRVFVSNQEKTVLEQWLRAIRLDKWLPSKTSVIEIAFPKSITVHGKICNFVCIFLHKSQYYFEISALLLRDFLLLIPVT
jgi:hypothetical protein